MAVEWLHIVRQTREHLLGHRCLLRILGTRLINHAAPVNRAGHEYVEVEPPGGVADSHADSRAVAVVGRGRVPQAAIEYQHAAGVPRGLYLRRGWREGIDPVVARRVVARTVALGHYQCAARLRREGREHPDRRKVHGHVGIWRWDVPGVILVERPVRVPAAPAVPWIVDDGCRERYSHM